MNPDWATTNNTKNRKKTTTTRPVGLGHQHTPISNSREKQLRTVGLGHRHKPNKTENSGQSEQEVAIAGTSRAEAQAQLLGKFLMRFLVHPSRDVLPW
jgi:hypothetical protein